MGKREELLISLGVVVAGIALGAIGRNAYTGISAVIIILALLGTILWFSNRRVDRRVVRLITEKLDEEKAHLLESFRELAEQVKQSTVDMRMELFQHWRSVAIPLDDDQSKIVPESTVLGLERSSREVWVWAYRLTWEIEDETTLRIVRDNLKQGVAYRYILPNTPEIRLRVRQFLDRLGRSPTDLPLEFRMREDQGSLLDQCVTIYHPSNLEGIEDSVVVLFPPKVAREPGEQLFVQLSGEAARPIRSNFADFWQSAIDTAF